MTGMREADRVANGGTARLSDDERGWLERAARCIASARLEGSFFFALSTNAERRSQVLTAEEVGDEVLALHAEGTWDW
jgi:hypothetical protein